jgi:hypothetical protein
VIIRLYIDEDAMSDSLIQALRSRGVDVISALDAGMVKRSDEEHLHHATMQGRALYSFNVKDYLVLHARSLGEGKSHAGIILAHQKRLSVGEQMRRILALSAATSAEEMKDQVEFLSAWGQQE